MNLKLAQITRSIYTDFNPLANPGRQLLGRLSEDQLKVLIAEKTKELEAHEKERIHFEIFGWGPLTALKDNEDILDIIVQGPNHIFFETKDGMRRHHDQFYCQTSFQNFVERICQTSKILINQKDPFGNGKVNSFRVHIVAPPITKDYQITLRRHRPHAFSLCALENSGFLTNLQFKMIKQLISKKANFLVIGPTGSGKTTLLNSIVSELPESERVVVVEDTDEILLTNPLHSKMLSREYGPESLTAIGLEELVKQSLRMRPDRLIVGEVRGKEAKDLLQALATGHSGSMGTLHADDPQQALIRLEMLIQMGAPQWGLEAIRKLMQLSLDIIITLKEDRLNKGVLSIKKIGSLENFGFLLEDYSYHLET